MGGGGLVDTSFTCLRLSQLQSVRDVRGDKITSVQTGIRWTETHPPPPASPVKHTL